MTFTRWQVIYWLQVGMVGFGLALSLLFVPDIKKVHTNGQDQDNIVKTENRGSLSKFRILAKFNPRGIFRLLMYPNILFAVGYSTSRLSRRPLSYKDFVIGFDLWLSILLSICASHLSPLHNQSTFPPHDPSC